MHAGIRTQLASLGDIKNDKRCGFAIVYANDIDRLGIQRVINRIKERIGQEKVYISVDIDVLDPAYAPATCNPPGELLILGGRLRSLDGLRENLFRSYGAWVELISLARMSLKLLQFMILKQN